MNDAVIEKGEAEIAKRLKMLIEASQSLASFESLDKLASELLLLAREVTSTKAASLMLYNPERKVLEFIAAEDEVLGEKGIDVLKQNIELKLGEGIAGWVAEHRMPVLIRDVNKDKRFSKKADETTGFETRALLCVPVLYREQLLGVIEVLNPKKKMSFDLSDQAILESFANLAAVAIVRSKLLEERLRQQKLHIQMETASTIQSLFWPKLPQPVNGSHVWGFTEPAEFVGGDLYDLISLSDGSWLIYVADVTDKGLPASLVMAALWSRIRSESLMHDNLSRLLGVVNNAMYQLLEKEGFFVTLIICRYWPANGDLILANAGHLPALKISKNSLAETAKFNEAPLGVLPTAKYSIKHIHLSPGESILLMTDVFTETSNHQNELFGQQRLQKYLMNTSGPPWGKGLVNKIKAWRGNAEPSDDMTLFEIWRQVVL
jgi:sigma-B regulation protein RsbU (phosphoserine phosphatase)